MDSTKKLHGLGQSLWLDNITRDLLNSGTLKRYIDDLSVTGLTSNPTIFDNAIKNSTIYDEDIRRTAPRARRPRTLFFELALEDLTRAADLFQPVFARTDGVDGWVSLEVSPLLAHDTKSTLGGRARPSRARRQAQPLHQDSRHHGGTARHRGGDLRRRAGQRHVAVLARAVCRGGRSLHARHRAAHRGRAEPGRRLGRLALRQPLGRRGRRQGRRLSCTNRLGIAVAQRTYKAYRELLASPRFQRAANAGARAQRLLWASTGTKDPKASDTLYVKALAAPFTVNTMPEGTLRPSPSTARSARRWRRMAATARRCSRSFAKAGIDVAALAARLQDEGADFLRQVLERSDGSHRFQERRD